MFQLEAWRRIAKEARFFLTSINSELVKTFFQKETRLTKNGKMLQYIYTF